jgi:hypothetical protein
MNKENLRIFIDHLLEVKGKYEELSIEVDLIGREKHCSCTDVQLRISKLEKKLTKEVNGCTTLVGELMNNIKKAGLFKKLEEKKDDSEKV